MRGLGEAEQEEQLWAEGRPRKVNNAHIKPSGRWCVRPLSHPPPPAIVEDRAHSVGDWMTAPAQYLQYILKITGIWPPLGTQTGIRRHRARRSRPCLGHSGEKCGTGQYHWVMVKGKQPRSLQVNRLDRYAVNMAASGGQQGGTRGEAPEVGPIQSGEPSPSSIMAAIQDLRGSISPIEPKLDAVTLEVNLLRADFGNISEKVVVAEIHIEGLLSTTKGGTN
ncbi:hypothetical protein NDU88_009546 [Pleurodeles waltl]|uniref:Uncharacterized protein n=1 Tax=Pleurodeles waltl TaxID=8319 RepID=A0AAV7QTA8_PLEWA|nr:hypothetical protein NDU88_009546 [Pleurodeles waltl]